MALPVLVVLMHVGRFVFFALIVSQCFLLASYPARYRDDTVWYAAALFYAPSVSLWLFLALFKKAKFLKLRQSFCVWALYVFPGLVPNIGIVFGVAGNELAFNTTSSASNATFAVCNATSAASNTTFAACNVTSAASNATFTACNATSAASNATFAACNATSAASINATSATSKGTIDGLEKKTLGPIWLKATLCVTPLLLLLLMNTASDAKEYKRAVSQLCVQLAVDLLDAVEMIDIVLEEQEHNYGISNDFGKAMISVACLSLLLSPWQMIEIKFIDLGEHKTRRRIAIARNIVEIIGVNAAFLIIRLVIVFKYEKDETIFIAKNIIAILLSALEIFDHRNSKEDSYA